MKNGLLADLDFIDVDPKLTDASQLRVVKLDKWDPDEVKEAADANEETMQKEEMEKKLEEQKKVCNLAFENERLQAAMSTSMPVESLLKEDEKKEEQPHEDSGGPEIETKVESSTGECVQTFVTHFDFRFQEGRSPRLYIHSEVG